MVQTKPITAAGGVVYRAQNSAPPEVILIYRRKVWDLPKGKLEQGESIEGCARREVTEEIGLPELPTITGKVIETYHEYDEGSTHYGKTTHWYAMTCPDESKLNLSPQRSEGIEKVSWIPLHKAKDMVGFTNLVHVLESFEKQELN